MGKVKRLIAKAVEEFTSQTRTRAEAAIAKCLTRETTHVEPFLRYILRWCQAPSSAEYRRRVRVSTGEYSIWIKVYIDDLDSLSDFYLDVIKPLLRLHPLWSVEPHGETLGGAALEPDSRCADWYLRCPEGYHKGREIDISAIFGQENRRCRLVGTGKYAPGHEEKRIECDV